MGLPLRCSQGHVYLGSSCPYCKRLEIDNDLFFGAINEEE